jgi:hypothetical protein
MSYTAAAAAVVVPLWLYLRTMAPTVYGLDSAELSAGAYLLGIVHAPGSPTFLLLGHLFTWLPFGDAGYRVNLLSTCAAAAAIGFVHATLWRMTREHLLALTGALYLATTYYFWVSALAAELYALHAMFVAALLWLAVDWHEDRRPVVFYSFCLLYGIGLGNHLSLSVLAPGFAYLVLAATPRPGLRRLSIGAVCVVAGWSVYLYLPLRAAAGVSMNYARDFGVDVTTWRGFWWMVTGSMFDAEFFGVPLLQLPLEALQYCYQLWSNFLGLGCILGFIGLWSDYERRRVIHTALALMFAGHLGFVLTYDVADKEFMLLPTFIIWAFWAMLGAREVARFIAVYTREAVAISGALLLLTMATANVMLNFNRVDISNDWSARTRGETLLRWLPADALYLATWADAAMIDYLQLVEGWRPDVRSINVFLIRGLRRERYVEEQLASGGAVYASAPVSASKGFLFEANESCDCHQMRRRPVAASILAPPATLQCRQPSWPLVPPQVSSHTPPPAAGSF